MSLIERLLRVCPDTTEDAVTCTEAAAELTRLRAMCDELAGAVEPFAREVDNYKPSASDTTMVAGTYLHLSDFRRARTAYAKYQSMEGGGL